MKDFSLFAQAKKLTGSRSRSDWGWIFSISRRNFEERESFGFSSAAPTVEYLCLLIENALLLRTNRAGRVYAGFEKLSLLEPIVERYIRIADISESVFIFGEPDWTPPRHPNIRIVALKPEFKLAREWFLIADSSTLHVAIVAQNEKGLAASEPDKRRFHAIKTGNRDLVATMATALEGLIDWSLAAKAGQLF